MGPTSPNGLISLQRRAIVPKLLMARPRRPRFAEIRDTGAFCAGTARITLGACAAPICTSRSADSEQPSPDKTEITKAVKQCVGADGRLAGDSDLRSVLTRRVDILRSWERHMEAEQEPLDALRTMMLENRALQISSFR